MQHLVLHKSDRSKFFTFLCIGLAWTCKLGSRTLWDLINVAFVSYIEGRSAWGKRQYAWYTRNRDAVDFVLGTLSVCKLSLFTIGFLVNLRRWIQVLDPLLNAKAVRIMLFLMAAETTMAAITILSLLFSESGTVLGFYYVGMEHFIVKPLLVLGYALAYRALVMKRNVNEVENPVYNNRQLQ